MHLQQDGNRLEGTHQGDFLARDVAGRSAARRCRSTSSVTERHGDALTYRFSGTVTGEIMTGALDLGEYLAATWTARRAAAGNRGV